MAEYEEQQQERARIRAQNAPKFDPTNPSRYIEAMANDDAGASVMGGVGMGGGGDADGAQITFVRLKPGIMKSMADTEELVVRWRHILTTIGLAGGAGYQPCTLSTVMCGRDYHHICLMRLSCALRSLPTRHGEGPVADEHAGRLACARHAAVRDGPGRSAVL